MEKKFCEINHEILSLEPKKIAIAVSGGADSICLALLLKALFKNHNTQIYTFTVDHRLRKTSALEALDNQQYLNSLGFTNEILTWQHKTEINSNIQSLARQARYDLLITKCLELGIKYLFIGHHQDDLAENFLIRLRRGSGLDGLAAIKKTITVQNVAIIRPLLSFTKIEIQNYLLGMGLKWFEDPSNQNTSFERVKVRNILKQEELLSKRIAGAANHLRIVKDYVEDKIKQKEREIIIYDSNLHVIKIELVKFLALCEYEQFTIISNALQFIGSKIYKPRLESLTKVIEAIKIGTLKNFSLHSCIITLFKQNYIVICKEACKKTLMLDKKETLWHSIYKVSLVELQIYQDLEIASLGQNGWQNFESKNLIPETIIENYPKIVFYALPVIKRLEKIVFIPHLNYYKEESYKNIRITNSLQAEA